MRLKESERSAIIKTIRNRDSAAAIYLFGSRVRDDARGGDIDLIAVSKLPLERERHRILDDLHDELGEQKIDIVITTPTLDNVFAKMLIKTQRAILL